ncbi:AAA family ATPase [Chitinophaga oryziterrae]|uniref:AAA family ATPase n=1 Tax=Chitinophaga oryziterrae TaxID=1031224 RepID=A0A6N8J3V0_9BACT|nr:ATP-binding protein [Chitinophaga oryziterrae]MVT39915.1 AAA family ATPase [Chitinophaga oryziterrae]
MLLSFAVTNFRSIRERVELNMLKTGLKGLHSNYFDISNKRHLLRSSAVYGPNASGKSVFLMAINVLEFLVERSSGFRPDQAVELYEPHRLEKSFASAPVFFEISFISNETQFDYSISFSQERIETEELYYYPTNTRTLLYSRYAEKEMKFGDYYKGAKKTLEKLLLPNQLFLSKAAENNVEVLMEPYRFITQKMMVYPFMEDYHESSYARLYARRLAEDKESVFSKRFNALICAVDTGITSVSVEEVDWSGFKFPGSLSEEVKKRFQEDYKYDIKTKHTVYEGVNHVGDVIFDVHEESSGTKSLFVIGGIIIEALETGSVLIVDEFEKSLHPIITQFLIQLFHNPLVNKRNAQLIFATHDVTQLSNDNFRRDQIWFTEKNEFGATNLFRCSDITGLRLGTPLDKWYATGRLGATPIINDVDFLIEMQSDEQGKS